MKKLRRDKSKAVFGGVCAGVANYFDIDIAIVRILTVLGGLLTGIPIGLIYFISWAVIPSED